MALVLPRIEDAVAYAQKVANDAEIIVKQATRDIANERAKGPGWLARTRKMRRDRGINQELYRHMLRLARKLPDFAYSSTSRTPMQRVCDEIERSHRRHAIN